MSGAQALRARLLHHRATARARYARPQPNGCKEEARTAERFQRVAGGRRQATAGVQTFDPRAPRRGARTGAGRRFLAPLRGARTPERFASGGVATLHRRLPSGTPPACIASKESSPAAQESDVRSTERASPATQRASTTFGRILRVARANSRLVVQRTQRSLRASVSSALPTSSSTRQIKKPPFPGAFR
jgi:hypothetical protein